MLLLDEMAMLCDEMVVLCAKCIGLTSPSQPPPQNRSSLQDDIAMLRAEYMSKGGSDPALLEAIQSLERDVYMYGGNRMPAAGVRNVA